MVNPEKSEPGPLLTIADLAVRYRSKHRHVDAVSSVELTIAAGETVALVGESGSGKSTTALALAGLLPASAEITTGAITFRGKDLRQAGRREWRSILGRHIGVVPQDPAVSLNPVTPIGRQVAEVLLIHGLADKRTAAQVAVDALAGAGIDHPELRAQQYPHELSGGMRQRVLIAIALVAKPELVIADEPTSALDVTVQRQILDNIAELTRSSGTSVLLVTHDLGVAADRADRILVMSQGRIVEHGVPEQILRAPAHGYTKSLIAAAPSLQATSSSFLTVAPVVPVQRVVTAAVLPAATGQPAAEPPILVAKNLTKDFPVPGAGHQTLRGVDDVSISIARGRTLALVGESGSGKTTVARLALRLTTPTSGRIIFDGDDISTLKGDPLRLLRARMQLVHQNPYASLNPRMSIEQIIAEPLVSFGTRSKVAGQRAAELVELVALPATSLERRPAELSGGQRQRVAIARALAVRPDLVVLDEPVSALDVRVQAQILRLLAHLQAELGVAYLFISHDLAVVRQISHQVGVMSKGTLVETGAADEIFAAPTHPYTRLLLDAIPGRSLARSSE
jgi:peptide/nickel transport system ATP-binding protein